MCSLVTGVQTCPLPSAVSNVIDNAVKHGSEVRGALRTRNDGAVEIDVADDGPGIASSLREKVFDPLFQGDNARSSAQRSGFGLGLSFATAVVKRHGGELEPLARTPGGLIVRLRSDTRRAGKD